MKNAPSARDECRRQALGDELVEQLARLARPEQGAEIEPGVHVYHRTSASEPIHGLLIPALCVIAQGSKVVMLGDEQYRYDARHYLLASVQLPMVSQVIEASPKAPYLSLRLDLDPSIIASVMVEGGDLAPTAQSPVRGIDVSSIDTALLDAIVRLVRLLGSPLEHRVLAPLVKREIVFRLLMGEQGQRLRHAAVLGGQAHRIAKAVDQLQECFDQPLRIESMARELGMSVSGFHHHFKAVTAMSPLQFQKQIRLQEARRLMLGEGLDAATAGYRVGYDNPSHFSREYKRYFGQPPARDVEQLRAAGASQ